MDEDEFDSDRFSEVCLVFNVCLWFALMAWSAWSGFSAYTKEQAKLEQGIFESATEEALKKIVRAQVSAEDDFYNKTSFVGFTRTMEEHYVESTT
eukprot:UN02864